MLILYVVTKRRQQCITLQISSPAPPKKEFEVPVFFKISSRSRGPPGVSKNCESLVSGPFFNRWKPETQTPEPPGTPGTPEPPGTREPGN